MTASWLHERKLKRFTDKRKRKLSGMELSSS